MLNSVALSVSAGLCTHHHSQVLKIFITPRRNPGPTNVTPTPGPLLPQHVTTTNLLAVFMDLPT